MIGAAIRKHNRKWLEKVVYRLFDKNKYISRAEIDRIIDKAVRVGKFFFGVALFMALYTVFGRIVYPRAGFEKTIILMGVVVIFLLRSFLEALGDDESPLRQK